MLDFCADLTWVRSVNAGATRQQGRASWRPRRCFCMNLGTTTSGSAQTRTPEHAHRTFTDAGLQAAPNGTSAR